MRRALLAAPLAAAALLLAGCTPTVSLSPAPQATTVGCAKVVVMLPDTVKDLAKRQTDAQGTAAWGTPAAVTLRCGVATPPTQDPCGDIEGVFWTTRNEVLDGKESVVLTTFGRSPGVQVVIDPRVVSSSDVLPALTDSSIGRATTATGARCTAASATSTTFIPSS